MTLILSVCALLLSAVCLVLQLSKIRRRKDGIARINTLLKNIEAYNGKAAGK